MDVNGTRLHLVAGEDDWRRFTAEGPAETPNAVWDKAHGAMTLSELNYLFEPAGGANTLDPTRRRSAGADRFGTIYWVGSDRASIHRLKKGQRHSEPYWSGASLTEPSVSCEGDFAAATPAQQLPVLLRGLAVTDHHYLVVGNRSRPATGGVPARYELLVFDLFSGGAPIHLAWPAEVPFVPWDLDAATNGGVWVLDRQNKRYWLVDRIFNVVLLDGVTPTKATVPGDFTPVQPGPRPDPGPPGEFPSGVAVAAIDPISIAGVSDDTVLVLDRLGGAEGSSILRYRVDQLLDAFKLDDRVRTTEDETASILAYDMEYVRSAGAEGDKGFVYVVEHRGNQAFRFSVDWSRPDPFNKNDPPAPPNEHVDNLFIAMQRYGGADLVTVDDRVLYDVGDRWIELRATNRPRYAASASLVSEPIDSGILDCAWHRILMDVCLPAGVEIDVAVRVANERRDLPTAIWLPQPRPYQRQIGTEIPFYDVEPIETIETLCQEVRGRWMQVRVDISATGRVTPRLHSMRVHYPRFSYLERYLPRVYRDDRVSASFVERLLADFEGLFTTWEGRIQEMERFFDPQAVPAESIDWLMGWLGVASQPMWNVTRKRLFLEYLMELYRWHGTAHGIAMALRLHLDPSPTAAIFDPPATTDRVRRSARLIECFATRRTGGAAQGLDTGPSGGDALLPLTMGLVNASAHRFVVLVPDGLDRQQMDALRRIVDLQKPAHSCYSMQQLWSLFRIGTARLEIDTDLGDGRCFEPLLLGAGYVGSGATVGARFPFNVTERDIVDRDRVGFAPAL